MEKFTSMKCENCGSVDYEKIKEGGYKCKYCGALVQNENSVKTEFLKNLSTETKKRKTIRFVPVRISEEDFYKKALAHIVSSEHTTKDVLTQSKINEVQCSYKYFAILDVDFTALKVSGYVSNSNNNKNDKLQIETQQEINYTYGKYITINLSEEENKTYLNYVSDNLEILLEDSEMLTKEDIKVNNIILPESVYIEDKLDETINHSKMQMLKNEKNNESTDIVHKINSIDIIAVPEYSLTYEYDNKAYKISSLANFVNITGSMPNEKKKINKQINKKINIINAMSLVLSLMLIVLGSILIGVRRVNFLSFVDIATKIVAVIFLLNILVETFLYKRQKYKIFNEKLIAFKEILTMKSYNYSNADAEYISAVKRWKNEGNK